MFLSRPTSTFRLYIRYVLRSLNCSTAWNAAGGLVESSRRSVSALLFSSVVTLVPCLDMASNTAKKSLAECVIMCCLMSWLPLNGTVTTQCYYTSSVLFSVHLFKNESWDGWIFRVCLTRLVTILKNCWTINWPRHYYDER